MMVLPTIPRNVVKLLDNIFRDFLWKGGKSKIAHKILQNPKKQGGLGLVNLEAKDKALKTTWPQILHQEQEYAHMVYGIMKCKNLKEDIWRCSLEPKDIKPMNISNQFWKDVLTAWSEYNYYLERRIENQIIWYNSKIRIKDKPFFWKDAYDQGLKYVYQLFTNKRLKTKEEVKEEFHISTLRYNSIITAIPKDWKEFFMEQMAITYLPIPPHNYDRSPIH